ncbi:MAG: hypothetical protein IOD00_03275, partial [Rhodobacter sp.]|nr:hypothetical protein [Rhodobacter sp.]
MADWTIEIAQLPLLASFGSHAFWVLKDADGRTVGEIQGFATDKKGFGKTAGGPFTPGDKIFMHQLSRQDLFKPEIASALKNGKFMSEWGSENNITFAKAYSGSEADVRRIWQKAGSAPAVVNKLKVPYGPAAVLLNYNSNSVAQFAGQLMGLDASPPALKGGGKANAIGWNKDLGGRLADIVIRQVNDREKELGRQLSPEEMAPYLRMLEDLSSASDYCFLPHTLILLADGTTKPIAAIRPGDMVLSPDKTGTLEPARVTRTFVNDVAHVLDFHGTGVTPGHGFLCGAGRFKGRHVPRIDILRDDGAVVRQDGSLMRASTGC